MKLEDIKATIDSYFDNISDKELFELLTTKYHMPVVYDIDMGPTLSDVKNYFIPSFDDIKYGPVFFGDSVDNRVVAIESPDSLCEIISNDVNCASDSLSYAA